MQGTLIDLVSSRFCLGTTRKSVRLLFPPPSCLSIHLSVGSHRAKVGLASSSAATRRGSNGPTVATCMYISRATGYQGDQLKAPVCAHRQRCMVCVSHFIPWGNRSFAHLPCSQSTCRNPVQRVTKDGEYCRDFGLPGKPQTTKLFVTAVSTLQIYANRRHIVACYP